MARTKILLADDQPHVHRLVAATLGDAQWELLYARDGEEALRIAVSITTAIWLVSALVFSWRTPAIWPS